MQIHTKHLDKDHMANTDKSQNLDPDNLVQDYAEKVGQGSDEKVLNVMLRIWLSFGDNLAFCLMGDFCRGPT